MVLKQLFGGGKSETKKPDVATVPNRESKPQITTPPQAESVSKSDEPAVAMHLEHAMVENVRTDNTDTRFKVYQELLFSDLLLALADTNPDAPPPPDQGTVNVAILTNPQNVKFAAAFTSAAASKRWRPEGGNYVTVRGQDLFKLLEPSPAEVVVINPGSAPFIALPKLEYRQLAAGIIPQSPQSPVQMAANPQEPQVAFPPDIVSETQKNFAKEFLEKQEQVDACAFGAMLPPGAKQEDGWVRTLFIRVKDLSLKQEEGQALMETIHKGISENEVFKETGFQLLHVPDPNFWGNVAHNNAAIFDNNPPQPQQQNNQEMQLAFPPDVFTADQKTAAQSVMESDGRVEAAAIGAILPPGANKEDGWVRTIFLRVKDVEPTQEAVQKFCTDMRDRIRASQELFKETGFEVGVMPDPGFWAAMNEQKIALFDRNPPSPQTAT
jgi:hypothetical protein